MKSDESTAAGFPEKEPAASQDTFIPISFEQIICEHINVCINVDFGLHTTYTYRCELCGCISSSHKLH